MKATKMNDLTLPWYADLLGKPPEGPDFTRLETELGLEPRANLRSSSGWLENDAGASVCVRDGIVAAVIFFTSEAAEYPGYDRVLPFDVLEGMSRDEIRERLGLPHKTRASHKESALVPALIDEYVQDHLEILFEYNPENRTIQAIRIQLPINFVKQA